MKVVGFFNLKLLHSSGHREWTYIKLFKAYIKCEVTYWIRWNYTHTHTYIYSIYLFFLTYEINKINNSSVLIILTGRREVTQIMIGCNDEIWIMKYSFYLILAWTLYLKMKMYRILMSRKIGVSIRGHWIICFE